MTAVLSVLLTLASLGLQIWIFVTYTSGQTPKSLPTLKKRGDQSSSQ